MNNDLNKLYEIKNLHLNSISVNKSNERLSYDRNNNIIKIKNKNNSLICDLQSKKRELNKDIENIIRKRTRLIKICILLSSIFLALLTIYIGIFTPNNHYTFDVNVYFDNISTLVESKTFLIQFIQIDEVVYYLAFMGHYLICATLIIVLGFFLLDEFVDMDLSEIFRNIAIIINGLVFVSGIVYWLIQMDEGIIISIIFLILSPLFCLFYGVLSLRLLILASLPVILPFIVLNILFFLCPYLLSLPEPIYKRFNRNKKISIIKKKCVEIDHQCSELKQLASKDADEYAKKHPLKLIPNPYLPEIRSLYGFLQDFSTVNSLIWAIENGYAYDIVSARNYYDRKKTEANFQRQLQLIQQQAWNAEQNAAYAAEYAKYAYEEAEAAKKASQAPSEIKLDLKIEEEFKIY